MASASVTGILKSALNAVVAARQRQADHYVRSYNESRQTRAASARKPAAE